MEKHIATGTEKYLDECRTILTKKIEKLEAEKSEVAIWFGKMQGHLNLAGRDQYPNPAWLGFGELLLDFPFGSVWGSAGVAVREHTAELQAVISEKIDAETERRKESELEENEGIKWFF